MRSQLRSALFCIIAFLSSGILIGQYSGINGSQQPEQEADYYGNRFSGRNIHKQRDVKAPLYGQGLWNSVGPFGGDVTDMAADPTDPELTFAAAGIPFRSENGGQNWSVMEDLALLSSNNIRVIESCSDGLLMASGDFIYGKGFRSTDGGSTWSPFFIPVNRSIYCIAFDPVNPDVIYLGLSADTGPENKIVLKSENGGSNWNLLNLISAMPAGYSADRISVDPGNPQTVFVVGRESFSNALVAASFDGGATWENRTSNLPAGKPVNQVSIANGKVYIAGGQLFGSQFLGVYESLDYGLSWQNISGSFPNKYCNDILIDPTNSDRIFVATEGDGIYYSSNGGSAWEFNTAGAGANGAARKILLHPQNQDILYAGFLSLAVCKSTDGAQNWEYSHEGIATLLINDVEVSPLSDGVALASFEAENSGGCYLSSDTGESWNLVSSLPATRFSAVTIGKDGCIYAWSNGPSSVAQEGLYKSEDGGQSWSNMGPNIGSLFETQIFSICISDENPELLFIGGNNFGVNGFDAIIYRTDNGGDNWTEVYKGIPNNSVRYLHIVPGTGDMTVLAAYKSQDEPAGFLKSENGGGNWVKINNGLPASCRWAGSITCDPTDIMTYYGGIGGSGDMNGTVYKSTDAGETWSATPVNLAIYSKINDVFVNPENTDVVYAASSQNGIYLTDDAAVSWQQNNSGMPALNITSFSNPYYQDDSLHVLAGTYTHSIFKSKVHNPSATGIRQPVTDNPGISIFPNPSDGILWLKFRSSEASVAIYTMQGSLVRTFEFSGLKEGDNSVRIDISKEPLTPGIYIAVVLNEGREAGRAKFVVRGK
ncbi:MAG: T9SS type A sorting domain-containing protein [Bacteroidales bacterium]|nr:T9SS type A sorting domain-containing protein [Bacteroidales bacterium]